MDAKEALRQGNSPDSDDSTDASQSKSLIANTYSNDGESDPDSYKNIGDWGIDNDQIHLAYRVTKGSGTGTDGLMRDAAATLSSSGSHEEWYSQLQVKLAHYIGDIMEVTLPTDVEPKGPVPLFEFLDFDGGDLMEFLRENPQYIEQLDSEELAELKSEYEEAQEEEAEEADE